MNLLFKKSEMRQANKHRIHLWLPDMNVPTINVVQVETERGHFQEYSMKETTFVYTIIEGKGVFFINDEPVVTEAGDIVVLPPEHRCWYAGKLKMVLASAPQYDDANETHHRFISEEEMNEAWEKYLS